MLAGSFVHLARNLGEVIGGPLQLGKHRLSSRATMCVVSTYPSLLRHRKNDSGKSRISNSWPCALPDFNEDQIGDANNE